MKAWIGEDGFIHVAAENAAERFALKWIIASKHGPSKSPAVIHEQEPVDNAVAAG